MLYRYIALIVLLVPSINHTAEIISQPTNKTRFQRLKESSQQKFRRFITDVNDPRSTLDLIEAWWDSKDLEEKRQIKRVLANRTLAELIALGIVLPPLWYITRGSSSGAQLPTIKLSPFMRTKLSHLERNKNNTYDVFTILNLPSNATINEINSAYRKLSGKLHSDKALQQEKQKREQVESVGGRVITEKEFQERLALKRDPNLPPVQELPSPAVTVSSELLKLYDAAFKALGVVRDEAIKYKQKQNQ